MSSAEPYTTTKPLLRPTRYELSDVHYPGATAATMGTENEYAADGRIRYARDLQDGNFDRAYDYDQAGRLKEAYSGREARGLPPLSNPDNPYRQSYTYNAWNNMGRTGKHWSAPVSDTPTYTDNRRADFSYDASGNVIWDYDYETHAYDAANQQINFHDRDTTFFGGGAWISNEYTIAHTYDGNGQAGKRIETRSSEDEKGAIESSTETSYNLRSTVLGGALIAKLNQWGGRDEGHIYAGGQEIATYYGVAPDAYISALRHTNPVTGNWVKTASTNAYATRTELDPLGADMSTTNPYVSNLSYADIMGSDNLYYLRGNALDIRGGCAAGGMPIPCSQANEAIVGGAAPGEPLRYDFAGIGGGPGPIVDLSPDFAGWLAMKGIFGIPDNLHVLDMEYFREMLAQMPQREAFEEAKSGAVSRLKGDCLKFLQELSGVTDASWVRSHLESYLRDSVSFGNTYLDGDTHQPTAFRDQGLGAITVPKIIGGKSRPGDAMTYFNAGSSFFTGNLTLNTGRVVSIMEPGRITAQSSVYGLTLREIQQLVVLHELAHAFDPKGKWDDRADTGKVAALNKAIRKACF